MPNDSRIEAGRRRANASKRALALVAAGGFVAMLGVARHTHPGTASSGATGTSRALAGVSSTQGSLSLGGGTLASPSPSSGTPSQVQTSTS
ncbi:MAG TPA: hypothetical protein VHD91_06860 [Gaiellaceae bacterium]|nr:hypothetical protein [Gaiellaceae bacterium]